MSSEKTFPNLSKLSQVTLASISCLLCHQSVIFAQEANQIQWSDRPDFLLVNNQYLTSNYDTLSPHELLSLSELDRTVIPKFSLTEISEFTVNTPDIPAPSLATINSNVPNQPTNNSDLPVTLTVDSSGSEITSKTEKPDKKWFFTIYGGTGTNSSLGQTLTGKTSEFYDSFFNGENYVGVEVGRKIANLGKKFQIEVTGQARQHFNESDYLALETAIVLRWHIARNSNFLNASLALGDGFSYVTDLPQVEANRPDSFKKSNLLNYLLIETTFSLPKNPDWSLVLRLNHRSGVFGIFNGARDGSNNLSVGIRHSF
ncbi:hypothetical protein [Merismopedia glauca]|uniref:Uncharacterized protein n=1 Tax=Merismopedia glauca CCAP 1448/3 TaxID=1296344 RepID=A0A2T1C317_9CYAN|nr:hypothetical protein [Merismopedia glauca]PSB02660.1 hypothetical protein C7B64_12165 [Merismopedia glauca CCAP 1448/3]